jgi:hypothetical protein
MQTFGWKIASVTTTTIYIRRFKLQIRLKIRSLKKNVIVGFEPTTPQAISIPFGYKNRK